MYCIFRPSRTGALSGIWICSILALGILIILFSLRLLSDPDLGFHLNSGRWIADHLAIPETDIATYTVPGNVYIDLHWLFQLFAYIVYLLTGYPGLSILVCFLVLSLFFLTGYRIRYTGANCYSMIPLILAALIIMEPRFMLRPELFTYLFFTLILIVLDQYSSGKRKRLYLLPVIMLFWCNMHSLFVLGFAVYGAYFISLWIKKRRPDLRLLTWILVAVAICLINPYGIDGFLFPFELLSRFSPANIFHSHIKEFQSLFMISDWTTKEFCFIGYLVFSSAIIIITLST